MTTLLRATIKSLPLFISILLCFCNPFAEKKLPADFIIEISASAMITNSVHTITPDSVHITYREPEGYSYWAVKLSPPQKYAIARALAETNLQEIRGSYIDHNATDCMTEYDFKIKADSIATEFHVYQVKLNDVSDLVQAINAALPAEHHINYNEEYFGDR